MTRRTVQAAWIVAGVTFTAVALVMLGATRFIPDLPLYAVALTGWIPWLVCVFAALHIHGRPALWALAGAPAVLIGPALLLVVLRAKECAAFNPC